MNQKDFNQEDFMYMEDAKVSRWTRFRLAALCISAVATFISMFAAIICAIVLITGTMPGLTALIVSAAIFIASYVTLRLTFTSLEKDHFKDQQH